MAEYIEREAALEAVKKERDYTGKFTFEEEHAWAVGFQQGITFALSDVAAIPAADVRPVVRWTLCEEMQPPTGRYLVLKKYFSGDFGYDVCSYAEDLSKIDKYDFPKNQYKGIGGWFDYDSETGYFQTSVYAWMPLPPFYNCGAKMEKS